MSTEENKALARRLIEEAWNQGNLAIVDELMDPGHVGHHSMVPNLPPSRDLYKQFIIRTRTAFPDLHATIEDQVAEGDLVMTRWSVQGTHQGMFQGHSPTGKQMTVTGIVIDRIVDGKAVEGWMEMDTFHQMRQLGLMPWLGQPS
jgi:predicted ester cyclase